MPGQIRFAPFRLDVAGERLWRGDVPVPLRPKTLAVLRHLAERPGELVTRDDLLATVWRGVFISPELPRISIRELRVALGDDARAPRFIATVPQRGYRFVAGVDVDDAADHAGAAASLAARTAARARAASARMVGRDDESAALERRAARARHGSRQIVFVSGDLGIGKTTLIEASLHRIAATATPAVPVWIGRGQCIESYGRVEPYQPVLDALEQLAELAGHQRMAAWLSRCAPLWTPHLPAFADGSAPTPLTAGAGQARMRRELLRLFEELGAAALIVLVLEDLHWSDDATVDLISAVARRAQPARLLLLCSFRPAEAVAEEHPVLAASRELVRKREADEIALSGLGATAVLAYLRRRFGPDLDAGLAELVCARSDGNPFAMVATADHLASAGVVVQAPSDWTVSAGATEAMDLPETLRATAEQQLARLAPAEIELLEAASVAGPTFASQCVAAALEQDLADAEAHCTRLARQGRFLRDEGVAAWRDGSVASAFGFTHVMYRDALYQRLPAARRALWHRRIGGRLLAGGAKESDAAALALHFERGGELGRALEYHRRAAEAAAARFAPREAATSLRRALAVFGRLEPDAETARTELLLQHALGQALQATQGLEAPHAGAALARARQLAEQLAAADTEPGVLAGLLGAHISRGELHAAGELSDQLLLMSRGRRRATLRYAGHLGQGVARTHLGDLRAARRHLAQAVRLYPQAVGRWPLHPGVLALCYAARVAFHFGHVAQARQYDTQARALAVGTANPIDQAWALQLSAVLTIYLREAESSGEIAAALVDLAEQHGLEMFARVGRIQRGWARAWLHGDAAAVAEMRRIFAWDGLGQHSAAFVLADASARIGDLRGALEVIDRALGLEVEERLDRPELLRLRGELLAGSATSDAPQPDGGEAAAETWLQAAIDESRLVGSRMFELRAATSLARLCLARRQPRRARRLVEPLLRSLTDGAESDDLRRARELLATLPRGTRAPPSGRR